MKNEKTLLLFDELTDTLNQAYYQVAFNKLENLRGNTYNGNAILADYIGNSIPESAKMVEIEGINLSKYKLYPITNIFHIHIGMLYIFENEISIILSKEIDLKNNLVILTLFYTGKSIENRIYTLEIKPNYNINNIYSIVKV